MKRKLGFNLHGEDEYKIFQDMILSEKGVECSVVITAHTISIRTESYADYVLAKSVVKPRTGLEIVRG
jgi:hypothetical protein